MHLAILKRVFYSQLAICVLNRQIRALTRKPPPPPTIETEWFEPSVCGYSSVLKEALKRHMLVHTGEKPYKCRICERCFSDFGTRQKHER